MANLLEQAIDCDDADRAARIIQNALGIESSDVADYVFPKKWPANREQRARIIIVRDNNGQALAYVYFGTEPGRRRAANLLTRDEARRIAVNIARLPRWLESGKAPASMGSSRG